MKRKALHPPRTFLQQLDFFRNGSRPAHRAGTRLPGRGFCTPPSLPSRHLTANLDLALDLTGHQQRWLIVLIFPFKWSSRLARPRQLSSLIWQQGCPEQPPSIPDHPGQTVAPLVSTPLRRAPHLSHSASGLARERPSSVASRAWGSLLTSAPPKHTPCPSQARWDCTSSSPEKIIKSNILMTPF